LSPCGRKCDGKQERRPPPKPGPRSDWARMHSARRATSPRWSKTSAAIYTLTLPDGTEDQVTADGLRDDCSDRNGKGIDYSSTDTAADAEMFAPLSISIRLGFGNSSRLSSAAAQRCDRALNASFHGPVSTTLEKRRPVPGASRVASRRALSIFRIAKDRLMPVAPTWSAVPSRLASRSPCAANLRLWVRARVLPRQADWTDAEPHGGQRGISKKLTSFSRTFSGGVLADHPQWVFGSQWKGFGNSI